VGLKPISGYRKVPITLKKNINGVEIEADRLTIRDMLSNGIAEPLVLCTISSTFI